MSAATESAPVRCVGIVGLPLTRVLTAPGYFAPIIGRLPVIRLRVDVGRDLAIYLVWHQSLKPVRQCDETPWYEVCVFDEKLMFTPCDTPSHVGGDLLLNPAAASS